MYWYALKRYAEDSEINIRKHDTDNDNISDKRKFFEGKKTKNTPKHGYN